MATRYGLEGLGFEPLWGYVFSLSQTVQISPGALLAPCTMCTGALSRVYSGGSMAWTTDPYVAARLRMSTAIILFPICAL